MKLVVYIIALVAIIGAAALSMLNIDKHQTQLDLTKEEVRKVISKKGDVEDQDIKRKAEETLRDEEKDQYREFVATKSLRENDKKDEKENSVSFDAEIEELLVERERINQVIVEIERELEDTKVPLEEVEGFVTRLENEKKDLDRANIVLTEELDVFTADVTKNKSVITSFQNAQVKRRNNLNANKISSLITAVDDEWGFVVVKPHAGSVIKPESKLVVIRGNKHIGRLKINAIENEAGRVLANIDYSSLVPGMRIRPGDRVILSEPLTQ